MARQFVTQVGILIGILLVLLVLSELPHTERLLLVDTQTTIYLEEDEKVHLVMVPPFLGNSTVLAGFYDYLDDFFVLHPIDLPGLSDVPRTETTSLETLSLYVEDEVERLALDEYIVGGMSFGFLLINDADIEWNDVQGVLAIAPYTTSEYLTGEGSSSPLMRYIIKTVIEKDWGNVLWQETIGKPFLILIAGFLPEHAENILTVQDSRTVLTVAGELLEERGDFIFQDVPYVLVINPEDKTVNAPKTIKLFQDNTENLFIQETSVPHYPPDFSKFYFREHLPPEDILEIIEWIEMQE